MITLAVKLVDFMFSLPNFLFREINNFVDQQTSGSRQTNFFVLFVHTFFRGSSGWTISVLGTSHA